MDILFFLQTHMIFTLILTILVGLTIGSFLNVVIFRYPNMLEQQWEAECRHHLKLKTQETTQTNNLVYPRSHCRHCKKPLKFWHNIPLISFLMLRGRCHYCKIKISPTYPIVELLSALTTMAAWYHFGITITALFACCFSWNLIVLSFIDAKKQLLPDTLTLSFLWIGLCVNLFDVFTTTSNAIFGAVTGYIALWSVAKLFKYIRKKEALGHGDFKMLAMLGAWLGATMLLNIVITSSLIAVLISGMSILMKRQSKNARIPFGPYLAIGGWLTLFCAPTLTNYLTRILT